MRKIFFAAVLIFAFIPIFAQNQTNKIESEYYGLKWGCSVADLKAKYPDAYLLKKDDDGDEIYYLEVNGANRAFFFGNGQLYIGRIAYFDVSEEKGMALAKKFISTYGKVDDYSKSFKDGATWKDFMKHYSEKIDVMLQLVENRNSFNELVSNSVFITTTNIELRDKILQKRINEMQDDLEL